MSDRYPNSKPEQKYGYVDFSQNREPIDFDFEKQKQETESEEAGGVRVNGYGQVLDLLRVADPEFRESLLKRIAQRDRKLANNLRRELDN